MDVRSVKVEAPALLRVAHKVAIDFFGKETVDKTPGLVIQTANLIITMQTSEFVGPGRSDESPE
jgi:hypothetical protein